MDKVPPAAESRGQRAEGGLNHENFLYGNYPNYYNFRSAAHQTAPGGVDPRLTAIDAALRGTAGVVGGGLGGVVGGRLCLDIGCNTGAISRSLVAQFHARRVVGVDIDPRLISRAIHSIPPDQIGAFSFATGDFAGEEAVEGARGRYAAVFCLSVTKWIHLHHGDAGIRRVFGRCYEMLDAGGVLVLEPQEWSTYSRKHRLSAAMASNYEGIEVRPDAFLGLLTAEIGFELVATVPPNREATRGFQRPIYVLRRGEGL